MRPGFLLTFVLALVLPACNNNQTGGEQQTAFNETQLLEQQKLWDEVMAIHDDVMPKMSDINRLTQTLEAQAKEAEGETKTEMETALRNLSAADEMMWDWMYALQQLTPLRDSLGHEAIMNYLAEEKLKIEKVRSAMLKAIEQGQALETEKTNDQ